LILDEPTSSLSEAETAALFNALRRLRQQGVGIIYISHRLEEVRRIADRITVLRDGKNVGTQTVSALDPRTLVRWMVGRDIKDHFPRPPWNPGAMALEVRRLCNARVHDVSFTLRRGEILGFAGLVGAGRSELARSLFGIDPIASGEILVEGRPVKIGSPAEARAAGIALVLEDRKRQGLVMTGSVAYNLALPWIRDWIHGIRFDRTRRAQIVARAIGDFAIKVADPEQNVGSLSGGNQQKVVVGRCMEQPPRILIPDEPTRGVDVGAREDVYTILRRLLAAGMAMILISSDLPEVMGLSHRLALYREGQIVREVLASETTAEDVMAELTRSRANMKTVKQVAPLMAAIVVLLAAFRIWVPQFLSLDNLLDLAQQISINAVLTFGMTLVILIGGIDLSVGAVVALIGTLTVWLLPRAGLGGAVSAGLVAATVFGAVNGICAARTAMPPFIITLATMLIARGLALRFNEGRPIAEPESQEVFLALGNARVLGILPVPVMVMVAAFVLTAVLLHRTRFGQHLYAIGGNREAARYTGIPIARNVIAVYVACSLLAGIAGMIHASQLYSAEPGSGQNFELIAIAAVVVGGTSFAGGVGTMPGMFLGAIIIGILDKGLNQAGVHFSLQYIVRGLVILSAVYLDVQRRSRRQ
jgi:ribose/xylose/arabinose/galactoside ABC-type transport system permease subunit/ABC-type multidrug transport system ATPase subunit